LLGQHGPGAEAVLDHLHEDGVGAVESESTLARSTPRMKKSVLLAPPSSFSERRGG
jgi:hypothetical protein